MGGHDNEAFSVNDQTGKTDDSRKNNVPDFKSDVSANAFNNNATSWGSSDDPQQKESNLESNTCNKESKTILQVGDDEDQERTLWDNPIEFILSCVALSVGLGNFWRFPAVAYENGGGAFLIPYLVVLFFIGRPLYFLELSLGQFCSQSSVNIWNIVPALKGIGYAQVVATWAVATYYCSIIAIAMFYFVMSFSATLPWSVCNPEWAEMETCVTTLGLNDSTLNDTYYSNSSTTSSEQYFKNYLLHEPADLSNGPGVPDWRLTICLFLSWAIICATLVKGVESSGKVAYLTGLFPYVGIVTLLIANSMLPGATDGMLYFITPQWEKIFEAKVWYAAVTQCFFSLTVAYGPIVMFSSHNRFRQNIYRDATFVSCMDTVNSLLSGFTVFSVLGYLKHITQAESFDEVAAGGTALVFVVYPSAIAAFEVVPQFFSVLFFTVLMTLGLGSATALTSAVINIMHDRFKSKISLRVLTVLTSVAGFLIGLVYVTPGGQWILDLVDFFGGTFIIYIIALLETVAVFWIYGTKKFLRDLRFMLGTKLGFYWKFCYCFFIPVGLTGIFIYFMAFFELPTYGDNLQYPTVYIVIGWIIFAVAFFMIPLAFFISYRQTAEGSVKERLAEALRANEKYRPRLDEDFKAWKMFCQEDGGQKLDSWKAYSKEAVEDPVKYQQFNELYSQITESAASWDTFKEPDNCLLQRIKNIFCS